MKRSRRRFAILALIPLVLLVTLPVTAWASITQSFHSDEPLLAGSLVSLTTAANTVTAASPKNLPSLYGVVTSVSGNTVQVATSDVQSVLVSTDNGDIFTGNPITPSGITAPCTGCAGFGGKATSSTRIVGYAEAPFNAKTKGAQISTGKDASGHSHTLAFGTIPVLLGVGYYAASPQKPPDATSNSGLPQFLQNIFDGIAGHQVVPSRIILSLFLLLVVVVIIGVIVGTSLHSSLISIGRNPLASRRIGRALIQVVVVSLGLMAGAIAGVVVIVTH